MILDRAENLRNLASEAHKAADVDKEATALAYVEETIRDAYETVSGYGIVESPWIAQLSSEARDALREVAAQLADAVRPLSDCSDPELAAYGQAAERGQLALLDARAKSMRRSLQDAHEELLASWRGRIWPEQQIAELRVIEQLSTTQDAAVVRRALDRLSVAKGAVSSDNLQTASAEIGPAEDAAERLKTASPPPDVVQFWQEVERAGPEGVSLANLSADLYRWLEEHGAGTHFRLSLHP